MMKGMMIDRNEEKINPYMVWDTVACRTPWVG